MPVNSPIRRMFGVPGTSAIHHPVAVGGVTPAPPGPPPGNGVLVRSLERHAGSPEQLVRTAQANGVGWVAILTLWQYEGAPPPNAQAQVVESPGKPPFAQKPFNQDIVAYTTALNQVGIRPWLWGHPIARPDAVTAFVQVVGALAASCGAAGVLVEPRASWVMQPGIDTSAANLVAQLRQHSGGRPVGVMSFASPGENPLPWGVFAQTADFGAPWNTSGESAARPSPEAAAREYAEQGFRTVVPVIGAEQSPPAGAPSLLWWDWYELSSKNRWDAVKGMATQVAT